MSDEHGTQPEPGADAPWRSEPPEPAPTQPEQAQPEQGGAADPGSDAENLAGRIESYLPEPNAGGGWTREAGEPERWADPAWPAAERETEWPSEPGLRARLAAQEQARTQAGAPSASRGASYTEKYRGTEWGAEPIVPVSEQPILLQDRPDGRQQWSVLRVIVIIAGCVQILSGLSSVVSIIIVGLSTSGKAELASELPARVATYLDIALIIGLLSGLFVIAWGLRILFAPGPWSLGCFGCMHLVAAFGFLLGVVGAVSIASLNGGEVGYFVVFGLFEAIIGAGTLLASQRSY
jgi:hypothetical protein